jgi:hypothetical protein
MATFTASYNGVCQVCLLDIDAGDEVGYIDGDLLCENCYVLAEDEHEDWRD